MGLNPAQFRLLIVRPTLQALGLWSAAAEELLLMTAAHESGGLVYLDQVTRSDDLAQGRATWGPAYGVYQIEAATHDDVFENFLAWRDDLREAVLGFRAPSPAPERQLATNLAYATAIARMVYLRDSEPLPAAEDVAGLAHYAKRVFNTSLGAATPEAYADAYRRLRAQEGRA